MPYLIGSRSKPERQSARALGRLSISVVGVFTDGTAYQMRAPSNRIASPTMYIDPVITTTASGRAEVRALASAAATSAALFNLS